MQVTDRPSPDAPSLTQAIIVHMVYYGGGGGGGYLSMGQQHIQVTAELIELNCDSGFNLGYG